MAQAYIANRYNEIKENPEVMIEMDTFKTNINTQTRKSNEEEVSIDNSYDGKIFFKILCVGDYSGGWSKGAFIKDYLTLSCDQITVSLRDDISPIYGPDISIKILYDVSAKKIRISIWNIPELDRCANYSLMKDFYCKINFDGVIVFWGANDDSMDSALKWKEHISQAVKRDIPFVLLVDNVFRKPAKWMGEGLVVNSPEEMNRFCLENGFFTWFEMLERVGGKDSVFGRAISTLVNEIISRNKTPETTGTFRDHSCEIM